MTLEQALQINVVGPWALLALSAVYLVLLAAHIVGTRAEVRRLTILVERSKGGRR